MSVAKATAVTIRTKVTHDGRRRRWFKGKEKQDRQVVTLA